MHKYSKKKRNETLFKKKKHHHLSLREKKRDRGRGRGRGRERGTGTGTGTGRRTGTGRWRGTERGRRTRRGTGRGTGTGKVSVCSVCLCMYVHVSPCMCGGWRLMLGVLHFEAGSLGSCTSAPGCPGLPRSSGAALCPPAPLHSTEAMDHTWLWCCHWERTQVPMPVLQAPD